MPEIDERIWSMHCNGKPPSEIDAKLGLEEGTARRMIAGRWADTAFLENEKRAGSCGRVR